MIALRNSYVEKRLDRFHVLRLHLTKIIQECELRERADESVSFKLEIEETDDADRRLEALKTKFDDLKVVSVL